MKGFGVIFLMLSLGLIFSCKTNANYDKKIYAEIMDNSVTLFAKEEKGKVQPGGVIRITDTLKSNVDSVKTTFYNLNKK